MVVNGFEDDFPRTCSHLPAQVSKYQYFFVVPRESTSQVLIRKEDKDGEEWSLPHIEFSKQPYYRVPALIREAEIKWGLQLTLTLNVEEAYDAETDAIQLVYFADDDWKHSHKQLPEQFEWADESILKKTTKYAIAKRFATEYFNEVRTKSTPHLRVHWALPGFCSDAKDWIKNELTGLGYNVTGEVEQVELSCLSLVTRIQTTTGFVYFKASAHIALPHESALTSYLHTVFPGRVPEAITYDQKYGLLMKEFKGKHLGATDTLTVWESAIQLYADLQIGSLGHIDKILELQTPKKDLDTLLAQCEVILNRPTLLKAGTLGLSNEAVEELKGFLPQLREYAKKLASFNIPYALDHGDLYPSNMLHVSDHDCLIFDWAEASITHPFFSLLPFVRELPGVANEHKDELLSLYFKKWEKYGTVEQLREAWKYAYVLGILLQGVKFWEIVCHIEPICRHNDQPSVPLWFGFLLKKLKGIEPF